MTKKQIETLKFHAAYTMTSDYLTNEKKIDELKKIYSFVNQARDLFLIDDKKRTKIISEIAAAAINARMHN